MKVNNSLVILLKASVTRFGEISPLRQHFMNLCQMVKGLFYVCQVVEPTLAKLLCFGAAFQCYRYMAKH